MDTLKADSSTQPVNVTTVWPKNVRIGNNQVTMTADSSIRLTNGSTSFPMNIPTSNKQPAQNKKSINKKAIIILPIAILCFNVIYFILTT